MKHDPRRCTTCRDYARHEKATRGPGNWVARLGRIHWCRTRPGAITRCGLRRGTGPRRLYWTLHGPSATCRNCVRVFRAEQRRLRLLRGR